ncbi:hypothetical protein PBAL39_21490 [Pedobacter sp. BAL39]|nr:hypothetical protein PBAL39_21490 [Pedobacter sp. BAL39]
MICFRSITISSEVSGSRLPVGSSARMISGLFSRARAITTRCCSPPESSWGILRILERRPTFSRTSLMRSVIRAASFHPVALSTNSRFFSTVRSPSNWKSWNTMPSFLRRKGMSLSAIFFRLKPATRPSPLPIFRSP